MKGDGDEVIFEGDSDSSRSLKLIWMRPETGFGLLAAKGDYCFKPLLSTATLISFTLIIIIELL